MSNRPSDAESTGTPSRNLDWLREYSLLLDAIPDAAFAQDENGVLISANAAAAQMTRFDRADLVGKNVRDLLSAESYHELTRALESAGARGESAVIPAHLITRDGKAVAVELRASFQRDDSPLSVQFVAREAGLEMRLEAARRQ